ncbi:putative helicase MOV-10 isoform X2 [Ruditapes philippinarum]|uniref:putative helicase MOV-10 isoform X2 n=1 Tax=Ruditapes philippinarum TaxID=129788 RepID=UPI00295AC49C|nr:putative helicase MOV-10 isoform X2 [Ruditapes philippinarum]
MIQKKNFDVNQEKIMIGSVEEFQGQEFKVIIISTVRSNQHYVQKDVEHRLGFVKNPKRFNVALTRARSLLVVIGNPMILVKDDNWKSFLDYCESNGGFKGQRGHLKPRERSENDSENLEFVHGELASSVRSQIEDQEFVIRD